MRPFAFRRCPNPLHLPHLTRLAGSLRVLRTKSDLQVSQMLRIYDCIATAHDLRLVGLAAVVCILASYAAINLLRYAAKSQGRMRAVWLGVSPISTGFGFGGQNLTPLFPLPPGIPTAITFRLTSR